MTDFDDHLATHPVDDLVDLALPRRRPTPAQRLGGIVATLGAALLGAGGCWPHTAAPPSRPPVVAGPASPAPVRSELPRPAASPAPTTVPVPAAVPAAAPAAPGPADPTGPVVAFALAQVGRPYERGAAGPDRYDCSGLVVAAYRQAGIELAHWSVAQADAGRAVDWLAEPIRAGDLVFTRGDTPVVDLGHVGIAIDAERWVSAPRPGGQVHVVPIPRESIQRVRRLLG